jgi:hypothetical protein
LTIGPPTDPPKLVALERRDRQIGIVEEVLRIQLFVSDVLERFAVELIGAGLGRDIYNRAAVAAVFRASSSHEYIDPLFSFPAAVTDGQLLAIYNYSLDFLIGNCFPARTILRLFAREIPAAGLASAIVTQWLAKSAYEACVTPLTYAAVNFLKRQEKRMDSRVRREKISRSYDRKPYNCRSGQG